MKMIIALSFLFSTFSAFAQTSVVALDSKMSSLNEIILAVESQGNNYLAQEECRERMKSLKSELKVANKVILRTNNCELKVRQDNKKFAYEGFIVILK